MPKRILFSIVLAISVFFAPFWLSATLALAGIAYFPFYFEATLLMLLSDLLYGVHESRFHGIVFISFALSVIFLISIEFLKKKLKFYPHAS